MEESDADKLSTKTMTVIVKCDTKTSKITINGNAKKYDKIKIIGTFLRSQPGVIKEKREPADLETYHIKLMWNPADGDIITVLHDTNHVGMRNTILDKALDQLCGK